MVVSREKLFVESRCVFGEVLLLCWYLEDHHVHMDTWAVGLPGLLGVGIGME
jgi:hypothetical protein